MSTHFKPQPRPALRCSCADLRMHVGLSVGQAVVMAWLVEGKRIKEVAAATGRTYEGVCSLRGNALRHSGCRNLLEFVAAGIKEGWVTQVDKPSTQHCSLSERKL